MIDGSYFIEDFHQEADGDDYAPAFMRLQQDMAQWETREVLLTRTLYRLSVKVDIIRPFLTVRGIRPGNSTGTGIGLDAAIPTIWSINGGAFETHYPPSYEGGTYGSVVVPADATARGDFFFCTGVVVGGQGITDGSNSANGYTGAVNDHGFRFRSQGRLERVAIKGFRGSGIYINASNGSVTNAGNANNTVCRDISIYNCGGPGIDVSGGDANVCSFQAPFTIVECGSDLKGRTNTFTRILVGQHMHEVTVTSAVNSTLYRLVVSGNNADYTSDSSATLSEISAGLAAAVNALALANIYAQQIDEDRLLVYSTNSATFTCTESSANMTLVTTTATATPSVVYLVGGGASTNLRLGDTVSCWIPTGTWRGFLRGDVVDMPDGYGYAEIDVGLELVGSTADSISNVSGSTWQIITGNRSWTGPEHTLRSVSIYGSATEANNGTFPTTNIVSGVYGDTSVRLRVNYGVSGAEYWVLVRGNTSGGYTRVAITAASASIGSIRDQLVTAIAAAGISGVSVAATSSADLTITCTGVIVAPGPWMDNVTGTSGRTVIEYTNAAGVADSAFAGTWVISNRVPTQGAYEPVGGALVRGRGAQVVDQPLIENRYQQVLINGATDGDGWVSKSGRSVFEQCYTEGPLTAISSAGGAIFVEGSMNPNIGQKSQRVDQTKYALTPAVAASYFDVDSSGTIYGKIGDEIYDNSALSFGRSHVDNEDRVRLFWEQTAQGDGSWELLYNESTALLRIANMLDRRIGLGSMSVGQPGLFLNYANGALVSPRSAVPNGSGGVTHTNEGASGAIGYLEAPRINGSYNCTLECLRVFPISGITNASHASVTTGTHSLPASSQGRVIIRNVRGMTGINGDRQWTRNAGSSIFLESTAGVNLDSTASGTYEADSGVAILCRLTGYGLVSGTSLSLADGVWVVGDRFVNLNPGGSDGIEWVCTTSGTGGSAVWAIVSSRASGGSGLTFQQALAVSSLRL